ncbi:glycoside hydrolase family 43 protein [Niabella terrae]
MQQEVLFTQFTYRGLDPVYQQHPLGDDDFYNPILQGCYPDPSIVRRGDDYFLVNSSFAMFPGVPIFHSTDLVNWKQIGHVLDRPSQLPLEQAGISGGIYAPAISYNPVNQTFYMITTLIAGGVGNMVVKSQDPFKGWSDIIKLAFGGIDPSLFFDDDGKAYLVHNDAPDQGKVQYEGHRVIKIWDYDTDKDQVVPGSSRIIVDGGVDIRQKPIWIEGPHIYKKNGKYYLLCAEGGTGDWHSEVVFVSDHPKGPYRAAPSNPILTQRYLDKDRNNKVEWTGHADLVKGRDGRYYGVFLGVRPNDQGRVNTGRETFLLPVDWSGDFPVFQNGLVPLTPRLKLPEGVSNQHGKNGFLPNGNFSFTDDFQKATPDFRWVTLRGPREAFSRILPTGGLSMRPLRTEIRDRAPISAWFFRQQHARFEASATLKFQPLSEKDIAGITCLQSESYHYVFGLTKKGIENYLVLARTSGEPAQGGAATPASARSIVLESCPVKLGQQLVLKVKASEGDSYQFSYSLDGIHFKNMGSPVTGDILSTNVAGGFTGALIGLYTSSANTIRP